MLFLLISFAALQTNALPQFHLPFSRFPEFGMATADMPDLEENFQIPETDLRMSLPKMDSKNVNKTSSKKKMKGMHSLFLNPLSAIVLYTEI